MHLIKIKGLTKKFGPLTAVDGLDITVDAGEIFAFLGPNGAGKTTTLKMMAGLIRPTSGTVLIGGHDILKEPLEAKRIMGFVPDRPFVYEKLTAREFMSFMGGLYSMRKDEVNGLAGPLLGRFGLSAWAGELVEGFSHGMRQRLVMAAALLHGPKVLVVDEPLVGLDPRGVRLLRETFAELKAGGAAIFLSTHSMDLAERVADRIGIISLGRLVTTGTVGDIKSLARLPESPLEDVFLKLTEDQAEGEEIL